MDQIDHIFDALYLEQYETKNIRSLTHAQRDILEKTKRGILSVLQPDDKVTRELVATRLKDGVNNVKRFGSTFSLLITDFISSTKREPTIKDRRSLAALAWAIIVNQK